MEEVYADSILLIGPFSILNCKVAEVISEKTGLNKLKASDTRDICYKENGYDKQYANKLKKENGETSRYEYSKPFEAYNVVKFLSKVKSKSVIAFDSTQTVYEDQEQFNSVFKQMKMFKNIILLLPDIDMLDSWLFIDKKCKIPFDSELSNLVWHLVSSPCNVNLASEIVYALEKNPEELASEILNLVNEKKESVKLVA